MKMLYNTFVQRTAELVFSGAEVGMPRAMIDEMLDEVISCLSNNFTHKGVIIVGYACPNCILMVLK